MRKKIAISTTSFGEYDDAPLRLCSKHGYEPVVNTLGRKIKPVELINLAKDAIGLIAGTEPITEGVISRLPELRVISRCGAGLDNIDFDAAGKAGIKVFNTPDAPTLAVAELTIGLILNLLRKINQMDALIRKDAWDKKMGNLLYRKKVGIIGFGRIGNKVAELLKGFGCDISFYDPFVKDGVFGFSSLEKEDLLKWADIISIHVSSGDLILGRKELKSMKRGSWVINVSRGSAIDEGALYDCLKESHIAGAALDIFKVEPYSGPLKDLANIILTPHIGSYAKESRIRMESEAVENLLKGLKEVNKKK